MLRKRDYRVLTESEKFDFEKVHGEYRAANNGLFDTVESLSKYYASISTAALRYLQLFPNNYLDAGELKDKKNLTILLKSFEMLLDSKVNEREILNFIKDNEAYFIISSLLKNFDFGHHDRFVFKEFELPPNYLVDYLIVGKNSGGHEFIFVELENPQGHITTGSGEFGTTIRKGIKQVRDWDSWLEANYTSLRLVYNKYIGTKKDLPHEFFELDKSRLHFIVIAGRRKDFNPKTRQLKRKLFKAESILLLHYDNLIESAQELIQSGLY